MGFEQKQKEQKSTAWPQRAAAELCRDSYSNLLILEMRNLACEGF
jgi:hypothetical protein